MECDSGAAEEARTPNTRAERLVKESAVRASELNTSLNAAALSGAFSGRSRHTEARTEPCKDSESANLPAGETDLVTGAPESLPPSGKSSPLPLPQTACSDSDVDIIKNLSKKSKAKTKTLGV